MPREKVFRGPNLEDAEPTPSEIWENEIPDLSDPLFLDAPIAAGAEGEAEDSSHCRGFGRERVE